MGASMASDDLAIPRAEAVAAIARGLFRRDLRVVAI
jgi:hypothetical protein